MNIFYLTSNYKELPKMLVNKHVRKMILEYAQLLSTAHHILDGDDAIEGIYKKTHINHPCTKWVVAHRGNYVWLQMHALELCKEFTYRFGKVHKTQEIIEKLKTPPKNIPFNESIGDTHFPPVAVVPDKYKEHHPSGYISPIKIYHNYYMGEKLNLMEKWELNPYWIHVLAREAMKMPYNQSWNLK